MENLKEGPEMAVKTMKCALCENHLSIPPIVVISEDGESLKCGRCWNIQTEVNIRNAALEAILKQCQFPCIFQHCHKKLRWGEAEQHERICPQRTIPCPFFECYDAVVIEDWESHFLNKHHKYGNVVEGEFTRQLFFIKYGVGLLIKNRFPYIIHYGMLSENKKKNRLEKEQSIWISVFSLRPHNDGYITYEVKFSSPHCQKSLIYEKQPIIPYNPREHCTRCLFHTFEREEKCYLPYHTFSGHGYSISYEAAHHWKTTKIKLDDIKKFFHPKPIYYTINIKDNIEKTPVNNDLLRLSLQCPICLQLMPREIYMCKNGHIYCRNCKPRLTTCPSCRCRIGRSRNIALEEIAEKVELVCQHQEYGCNFTGNVQSICQHEAECYYNIINCTRSDSKRHE